MKLFEMTPEQRQEVMDANPPVVSEAMSANAYFNWGWKGCGFGQLSFSYDHTTEKWSCSTEMMGPEKTRALLHAFADHVADQLTPVIVAERDAWDARAAELNDACKVPDGPYLNIKS